MATELKKVHIDGVDYEAEGQVIATLHQATTKIDTMQAEHADALETLQAHADALEAERDQLKADNEKLKADMAALPAQIKARADSRIALIKKAELAGVEVKDDMDDTAIMVAVITKTDAAFKADGKSADYLAARFDAATVGLKLDSSKSTAAGGSIVKTDAAGKPVEAGLNKIDAAEQAMKAKNAAAWKKPTPQAK